MGEPILIIGAGIGGLSAALALHRAGLQVEVYERADEIKETGAGLTLTETGSLALEALGLKQESFDLSDSAAVTAFIHYQTGEVFHTTSAPEGEAAKRLGTRVCHHDRRQAGRYRAGRRSRSRPFRQWEDRGRRRADRRRWLAIRLKSPPPWRYPAEPHREGGLAQSYPNRVGGGSDRLPRQRRSLWAQGDVCALYGAPRRGFELRRHCRDGDHGGRRLVDPVEHR
jgi:choline dehydrogenase-like flavoprotein